MAVLQRIQAGDMVDGRVHAQGRIVYTIGLGMYDRARFWVDMALPCIGRREPVLASGAEG